ncbi:MAG: AAA family ATPase [Candidatus Hadarchaeales archaeon]
MEGKPLSILLAAPRLDEILQKMYPPLAGDPAKFQVIAISTELADLRDKLSIFRPEVALIDSSIASKPEGLVEILKGFNGVALIILPPEWVQAEGLFRSLACVREVFSGQVINYVEVAQRLWQLGISERALKMQAVPVPSISVSHAVVPAGLKIFAFRSKKGGVGKTTLALNFAAELSRRGIATLLMSFDIPDDVGVYLGLPPSPNQLAFFTNPTPAGLRGGIQKKDALDILLSVGDEIAAEEIARRDPQEKGSIRSLILTAAISGYSAIVLDLPPGDGEWSLQPLLVANTVFIVAQPTLADLNKAYREWQLLTQKLANIYAVPSHNVYIILNCLQKEDNITPSTFSDALREIAGGAVPPVIATFKYEPAVRFSGNLARLALYECEGFAKSMRTLVDFFYRGVSTGAEKREHKLWPGWR